MMEMTETFPAQGRVYEANFGGDYIYRLRFDSDSSMTFTGLAGATKDFTETVGIVVTRIRPGPTFSSASCTRCLRSLPGMPR